MVICMKEKLKAVIIPFLTAVAMAIYGYGSYALYYEFDYWPENTSCCLYIILMTVACAFFGFMAIRAFMAEKFNKIKAVIGAVTGGIVFNAVFWITNAAVNNNPDVIVHSYSVMFPLIGACLLFVFIKEAMKNMKIFNFAIAAVYFCVSCAGGFVINADRIENIQYNKNISFDSITASEMVITEEEKAMCRQWYNENVLLHGDDPQVPYTFDVDGVSLADNIDEWEIDVAPESKLNAVYAGGKTSYVYLTNEEKNLEVIIEATIYEDNATCEWALFMKNTGTENSDVISNLYGLKASFETGNSDVYYSKGSHTSSNDFALGMKNVGVVPTVFDCVEGRSSYTYMPYFNISGETTGLVVGVGWSGEWETSVSQLGKNTNLTVKQAEFEAYLLPEEVVRTPLVSVSFYNSDNALKGFNQFRNWMTDCVIPANIPDTMTMLEVAGPESTNTADQIFETLDSFGDEVYSVADYFWMDAGWYDYIDGWYDSVGNWTPDTDRYDNGISEISDYAEDKDCGLVLWYESERVYPDTKLGTVGAEHENWLVFKNDGEFAMWNFAEIDAAEYIANYIAASLVENGVSVFRHDFNFDISGMWKTADKEFYDGRKGICENHYVNNFYRYLDYLSVNVDGLIIDNCASGGRRLDLEMMRRSVPLWRSDYNCSRHYDILEATQAQTYGLSFWIPMSGTIKYSESEYSARSGIMFGTLETFGTVGSEYYGAYKEQRELTTGNFYPISDGKCDTHKILAMQYSQPDGAYGEALIYKRADVRADNYTLIFNGLDPEKKYNVYDYDNPDSVKKVSGKDLMETGYDIALPEGEKAVIIMYSVVG